MRNFKISSIAINPEKKRKEKRRESTLIYKRRQSWNGKDALRSSSHARWHWRSLRVPSLNHLNKANDTPRHATSQVGTMNNGIWRTTAKSDRGLRPITINPDTRQRARNGFLNPLYLPDKPSDARGFIGVLWWEIPRDHQRPHEDLL